MKNVLAAACVLAQLMIGGAAAACSIAQPKGEAILAVDGMINDCNEGLEVHLDRALLESLPRTEISTENPWEHGRVTYQGVLLSDLLKLVKADGKTLTISALNDYRADLSIEDAQRYRIILAYQREGVDIPVRDKGPLFVVFPFSDQPDLATEARYAQSVWQVNRITVK